ncbi:MAG: polysaccharide export protein [Firmicutes bacterium]|nr:polysaccharide export protein [Bacillota bacterium]
MVRLCLILAVAVFTFCTSLGSASPPAPEPYRLDTGDVLRVTVWGHDDLTTEVTVAPDGSISLPLLGTLVVRGATLVEVERMVAEGLVAYVRDPRVTVALVARRQITIKVFGQVNRPGAYQVNPGASIAELIAMAGGPTKRAALENVQLLRGGDPEKVQVVPQGKGNRFGKDVAIRGPELFDGDVIFVPETTGIDWEFVVMILGGLYTLKQLLIP